MELSNKDFDIILSELFGTDTPCFDTLCARTVEVLRPTVEYWCSSNPILRNKCCEDDIIQDTELKVLKYSITHFFFAGGKTEPNNDRTQFNKWLFTVAKNVMRDYVQSYSARNHVSLADFEESLADEPDDIADNDEVCRELTRVVDAVINLRVGIHKILAWLLISLKIINTDGQRSKITDEVVDRFGIAVLFDMYIEVQNEFILHPVIWLATEQKTRIERSLLKDTGIPGKTVGDTTFGSYFGLAEGKYAVSDWIYKINLSVRRSFT